MQLTDAASKSRVFRQLPERFTAFHWHGDTCDLPPGATWIAESDACRNQAFEYGSRGRVIGMQFHLDTTFESIRQLVEHCGDELIPDEYTQGRDELLVQCRNLDDLRGYSGMLFDCVEGEYKGVREDD